MYEKASVKGVGYKNVEMIVSTQTGFNGQKLVEKESGSGNVITERTELEAERQLEQFRGSRFLEDVPAGDQKPSGKGLSTGDWVPIGSVFEDGIWTTCAWPTGTSVTVPNQHINTP